MISIYTIYDSTTGQILKTVTCDENDIGLNVSTGFDYIQGAYNKSEYTIDVETKQPVAIIPPEPTLEEVKAKKLSDLKDLRDKKLSSGFTWDAHVFDSDQTAQTNLLGLYMSAVNNPELFPMNWRLADNSWVSLTAANAIDVWKALQTMKQTTFNKFADHETAINALTTVTDVNSYDIATNW